MITLGEEMRISRGAKRCLRLLRTFNGEQSIPQWLLAKKLRCSVRTVKRYIRELRDAGRIRVVMHGPKEATYVLSNAHARHKNVPSFVPSSPARYSDRINSTGVQAFLKTEANAIERHIRACRLEPTPQLLSTLARQAQFYGVNGFRIAAEIERARRKVEGTSRMPRTLGWVFKVVENALKNQAVHHSRHSEENPKDKAQPRFRRNPDLPSDWQEKITVLARMKKM